MNENLTHTFFAERIGESFRLVPPTELGEPFDLELVAIRTFEASAQTSRAQPFAIEFRGPGDKPFSQGMWHLEHAALGAADIFLVPVGPDEKGPCYEAVFN